mmetsp:Transcript_46454/g.99481  ORF Transcript_46454/g.99481 Transcript_46454/m.99481 type:complete len:128 (+) Transcript_46454:2-385(+)
MAEKANEEEKEEKEEKHENDEKNEVVLIIRRIGCRCTENRLQRILAQAGCKENIPVRIPWRSGTRGVPTNFGYGFAFCSTTDEAQEVMGRLSGQSLLFGSAERTVEVTLAARTEVDAALAAAAKRVR